MDDVLFASLQRKIREHAVFYAELQGLLASVRVLEGTCEQQSCLIAALIESHDGAIPSAIWDKCHQVSNYSVTTSYDFSQDTVVISTKPIDREENYGQRPARKDDSRNDCPANTSFFRYCGSG